MDVIKEILQNYWKEIISVVLFIASVIIALVRKKPVSDILTYIYDFSVLAVNAAEKHLFAARDVDGFDKGAAKKQFAIESVKASLTNTFPDLDISKYEVVISSVIETLLTTPQKKG